jgi:hypothetical protein
MKLQLDESTLNAYINEAIKEEMNESWDKLGKLGSKAKNLFRGATKGVKNYGKALGGNKKSVKALEQELGKLRGELDDVLKKQKAVYGTPEGVRVLPNGKQVGTDLVDRATGLRAAIERGEKALAKAKGGATLARGTTAAAAGGFGAGYLAGRSGRREQNPEAYAGGDDDDAPWNNGVIDDGDEGSGPWDGTFPWDDTTPRWTPRPVRPPVQPKDDEEERRRAEEAEMARRREQINQMRIGNLDIPNLTNQITVPGNSNPQGIIQRPQDTSVTNRAIQTMGAHALSASNGQATQGQALRGINRNRREAVRDARRRGDVGGVEKANTIAKNAKEAVKGMNGNQQQ